MEPPPFEELVARHGATVLRVCRALLGPADADDAWSETFLAALRAYPGPEAIADPEAWLVTIAHRKAVDEHRRRGRAPVPVADPPERAAAAEPAPADTALWDAVRALPPRQRQAVAHHHIAGLPYARVAAIIGCSEAAARRAAADGIARLRRTYPQEGSR